MEVTGPTPIVAARTVQEYREYGLRLVTLTESWFEETLSTRV